MMYLWYVSLSVGAWTTFYVMLSKLNQLKSAEWNSRIIAMSHALIVTRIIEISFILENNPFYSIGEENSSLQNVTLIVSTGYFLYDFAWCIFMGTEGTMMLMHHIVSIVSLLGGLFLNHSGSEICITLWGSELTNPFLQIRWFLRETKQYNTSFGAFNDFVFTALFACARIGIGTGLAFYFFWSKKTIIFVKVAGFLFFLISIIWMWQILKFMKRKYFCSKGPGKTLEEKH